MNDTLIFLYLVFFVILFASTFAFMWRMMSSTLSEMDRRPIKSYADAMKPYKIPAPHPEMEGVKTGEELLVFSLEDIEDDEGEDETYIGENI